MNGTDKAKPTAVDCPKCGLTTTGYFCACGKDLRQFFGIKPEPNPARRESPPQPTVETFLRGIGLEDYSKLFTQNDITSIQLITALTDEDLRSIGIVSLGHRKLLLGAFKEKSSPKPSSNTQVFAQSSALSANSSPSAAEGTPKAASGCGTFILLIVVGSLGLCGFCSVFPSDPKHGDRTTSTPSFDVNACRRGNLDRLMACDPQCSAFTGERYDKCAEACVESRGGRVENCNR